MSEHPNCQLSLSMDENGTYSSGGAFNSGTDLPISGRISLDVTWTYTIAAANPSLPSDCALLSACYGTGPTAQRQFHLHGVGPKLIGDLLPTLPRYEHPSHLGSSERFSASVPSFLSVKAVLIY